MLIIQQDNVYAHEVTLHELNVLHDGSDLNGPLRLCMKVFTPRFVTRYTTLRDQITRLNLSGDGDEVQAAYSENTSAGTQSEQREYSRNLPASRSDIFGRYGGPACGS